MKNSNKILDETPFQTAGPFLHIGCMPNKIKINNLYKNDLGEIPFKNKTEIEMITVEGSVFDGNGKCLNSFSRSKRNTGTGNSCVVIINLRDVFIGSITT